jgi:phosphoglycolate phosphatase
VWKDAAVNGTSGGLGAELPSSLILWDVDHTLIENGGVSKETYALAFELLVGRVPAVRPVTDGRTDFQIMSDLLEANSVDTRDYVDIAQFEGVLVEAMEAKAPELPARGYVLAGVLDVLTNLAAMPNVIQSVLTGNIAPNAAAKVGAFGLEKWVDLEVGGFGSDDKVRSRLVDASRTKVMAKYGREFDRASTILIGDTPLDVKAAHDGGARVLAVASGVHGADELAEAGADAVLDDLSELELVLTTLGRLRAGQAAG